MLGLAVHLGGGPAEHALAGGVNERHRAAPVHAEDAVADSVENQVVPARQAVELFFAAPPHLLDLLLLLVDADVFQRGLRRQPGELFRGPRHQAGVLVRRADVDVDEGSEFLDLFVQRRQELFELRGTELEPVRRQLQQVGHQRRIVRRELQLTDGAGEVQAGGRSATSGRGQSVGLW